MDNYIVIGPTLYSDLGKQVIYGCLRCGNLVYDQEIHDRHHEEHDKAYISAVQFQS